MKIKNGFTLVEILAVIIILGVLLSVASINVVSKINNSKDKIGKFTLSQIEDAAKTYALDHDCGTGFLKCSLYGNDINSKQSIPYNLKDYYPEIVEKCTIANNANIWIEDDGNDIKLTKFEGIECKE